jgi:PilZ domain
LELDQASEGRRQHERYPLSQTVAFELSAPLTLHEPHPEEAAGDTKNVSEGGLCLITERPLEESQIIKVKLPIPNVVATTPTLAEVRWVKRQMMNYLSPPAQPSNRQQSAVRQAITGQRGDHYLVGLRFLF